MKQDRSVTTRSKELCVQTTLKAISISDVGVRLWNSLRSHHRNYHSNYIIQILKKHIDIRSYKHDEVTESIYYYYTIW